MLRHIAMFSLQDDAPEGTLEHLCEGLALVVRAVPGIEAYTYGQDLGLRAGNFDFAVVADFADAKAFAGYVEHPAHRTFITERLTPVVAERVSAQFEL
jgi:hypothetical protein